jgi:predicted amidohydrolase
MRDVIVGFELLQYGNVMRWGRTVPNAESALLPAGESDPPLDHWLDLLTQAQTVDEVVLVVERARSELRAWRRRPDPPPDGESFEDLKRRIVTEGEGWTPQEVALAMRVTPTLVRNVRGWAERDPDYGRPDQSLAHGLSLLSSGCSLRQAAQITGIPKSTLHDAMRAAA